MPRAVPKWLTLSGGNNSLLYASTKRALDLCLCFFAIPVLLPLLLLGIVLVKVSSPGPIFFVQDRTGLNGRRFHMYKLRTMVENAAELKADLLSKVPDGPDFKLEEDPRVTKIGRWLRRTSIDELPQVWNVIKGDMSLVGPRPTSFGVDVYSLWHTERLEVPPGLTGLWQTEKRGDLDFDERVRLDITYARYRSIGFDLWIIGKTIRTVIAGRGAY